MDSVLQDGQTLIAQVEAHGCTAQSAARAYDMHVDDVGDADQHQDQHLFEDSAESNRAGQFLVHHRAHDAGGVVDGHEDHQRNQEAVHASKHVAQPAAQAGDGDLQLRPDQVNRKISHIHGANGVVRHSGFKAISGLSAVNPVMAVGIAMQAMAAVSGQYYLKLITSRLDSIEGQLNQIASLLTAQNLGVIRHSHKRLISICNHGALDDKDIQEIRSISNDVGQVYETYRELYEKQKRELSEYNPVGKGAQRLYDAYKKKVTEFYQTTQICALAYQVYLQAKLAEITVTYRLNPESAVLNDLRNDAVAIYNDPFDRKLVTNPQTAFNWVLSKAEECLTRTNFGEELTGILDSKSKKEENRRKQLAPLRESTRAVSVYADRMMDHRSSKQVLEGLDAPRKMLILPAKAEQRERIFIEA